MINACQLNGVGTIRIVTDARKCIASYETPISWNTTGAAGPAGSPGPAGRQARPDRQEQRDTTGRPVLRLGATGPASTVPAHKVPPAQGDDGVAVADPASIDRVDSASIPTRRPIRDAHRCDRHRTEPDADLRPRNAIVRVGPFAQGYRPLPSRALSFDGVDGVFAGVFAAPGNDISTGMFISRDTAHPFSVLQRLDNGWFADLTGTGASASTTGDCMFVYHLRVAHA